MAIKNKKHIRELNRYAFRALMIKVKTGGDSLSVGAKLPPIESS